MTTSPPNREEWESRYRQRACVIWLYGLSGAGKSTLSAGLLRRLYHEGYTAISIDGDDLRAGLNAGLGFSDADRSENIRRAAAMARHLVTHGMIVVCSLITPQRSFRQLAKDITGHGDFFDVYIAASFETCARRDPKGIYARAASGQVKQFTGKDSRFEPPAPGEVALALDTESASIENCLARLHAAVVPRIKARA